MAAVTAKGAELQSAHVFLQSEYAGGAITKREAYFRFAVEWRGEQIVADATADTYAYAPLGRDQEPEWSKWRVIVSRCNLHVTETARSAIQDAVRPLALEWIESEDYKTAHRSAVNALIKRTMRDERYSVDASRRQLEELGDELDPFDRDRLARALELLEEFLAIVTPA